MGQVCDAAAGACERLSGPALLPPLPQRHWDQDQAAGKTYKAEAPWRPAAQADCVALADLRPNAPPLDAAPSAVQLRELPERPRFSLTSFLGVEVVEEDACGPVPSRGLALLSLSWNLPPPIDRSCVTRANYPMGWMLHQRVPASLWCVTEADLDSFVALVSLAHKQGKIPDDPDYPNQFHDKCNIGPSMHQVDKYVIQPLTLARGGMSWALMQHPDGLPIDFFVTHCWAEGVYEFYNRVKRNWPSGKNGWICFLANPQSWCSSDLSELIGSADDLSDSPFVKALEAPTCSMMLVVPNATVSIYTRLWCIEEARRAILKGMKVKLAFFRLGRAVTSAMCVLGDYEDSIKAVFKKASHSLGSTRIPDSMVGRHIVALQEWKRERESEWRKDRSEQARRELQSGFSSVTAATCSNPEDERRIRSAMNGMEDLIDAMITKLTTEGKFESARRESEQSSPPSSPKGEGLQGNPRWTQYPDME